MDSSRMRTGGCLVPGGVPGLGGGSAPGGCLLRGVSGLGGSGPGGGVWSRRGIPACTEADPPVNRMTDRCKNITFANFVCGR